MNLALVPASSMLKKMKVKNCTAIIAKILCLKMKEMKV